MEYSKSMKYAYGGSLRQKKNGRAQRPLSVKHPHHVVFKVNRRRLRSGSLKTYANYRKVTLILRLYAIHFHVKLEQMAVEGDHIHLLVRAGRRAQYQNFFRVVAGQIAQRLPTFTDNRTRGTKLWRYRPFTKIVGGPRYLRRVKDYIQLNHKESIGQIPYRKERLRGLSMRDWEILWA